MSEGTLSPDGKFMWLGGEWIPAPPVTEDNEKPTEPSDTWANHRVAAGFESDTWANHRVAAGFEPAKHSKTSSDNDPVQSGVDCPYCKQRISKDQSRCHHCRGTLLYCKKKWLVGGCERFVGVTEKRSWGGMLFHAKTFGWKHYKACMRCENEIK